MRGFRETCRRLGLDEAARPVLSVDSAMWEKEELEREFLDEVAGNVFQRLGCTACVCYNDALAVRLLRASQRLGKRVPEDLSIVGFDDSAAARLAVTPITSVGWDLAWMGRIAAGMLVERIEHGGEMPCRGTVVGARLIVRQSTGPPGGRSDIREADRRTVGVTTGEQEERREE